MENNQTSTERMYRGWHTYFGSILIIALVLGILINPGWYVLVLFGLIPQGIFQFFIGLMTLADPKIFKLKDQRMLVAWFVLSVYVLYVVFSSNKIPFPGMNEPYYDVITVMTLALPFLQYFALTYRGFKTGIEDGIS